MSSAVITQETKLIQARVPVELVDALQDQAEVAERTLSAELRLAIRTWLAPNDERRPAQSAAVKDRRGDRRDAEG